MIFSPRYVCFVEESKAVYSKSQDQKVGDTIYCIKTLQCDALQGGCIEHWYLLPQNPSEVSTIICDVMQ